MEVFCSSALSLQQARARLIQFRAENILPSGAEINFIDCHRYRQLWGHGAWKRKNSILTSTTDNKPLTPEAKVLLDCIKDEFSKITIRRWGHFFPIQVATIRFIFQIRPGAIGDISARYDTIPAFSGRGAEWLVNNIFYTTEYQDLVEPLWYEVVGGITPSIKSREYMAVEEIPSLDPAIIEQLNTLILEKVEKALSDRSNI